MYSEAKADIEKFYDKVWVKDNFDMSNVKQENIDWATNFASIEKGDIQEVIYAISASHDMREIDVFEVRMIENNDDTNERIYKVAYVGFDADSDCVMHCSRHRIRVEKYKDDNGNITETKSFDDLIGEEETYYSKIVKDRENIFKRGSIVVYTLYNYSGNFDNLDYVEKVDIKDFTEELEGLIKREEIKNEKDTDPHAIDRIITLTAAIEALFEKASEQSIF